MGMYTELVMNVGLKDDTPQGVIDLLKAMVAGDGFTLKPPKAYEHEPLFSTDRWRHMLKSCSYYFIPESNSKIIEANGRYVSIRCDLKNYDGEIGKFADFIAPFVECDGFGGYSRYEEDDHPTLLYFKGGKAVWKPAE